MRLLRVPLFVIFLSAACENSPQKNYVVTRDSLVAADSASKAVGESCEEHGSSECLNSLCLAVATARSSYAHICTQLCRQDKDCPEQFSCGEVAPRTYACLPERTWVERPATPRSARAGPSRSAASDLPDAGHEPIPVNGDGDGGN